MLAHCKRINKVASACTLFAILRYKLQAKYIQFARSDDRINAMQNWTYIARKLSGDNVYLLFCLQSISYG